MLGSPWPLRSRQKGQLELSVTPHPWPHSLMLRTIENQNPIVGPAAHSGGLGASMPADRKGSLCRQPFSPVARCDKCPGGGPTLLLSTLPGCCRQGCPQLTAALSQVITDPAGPKTQSQALQALLLPSRLCCCVGLAGRRLLGKGLGSLRPPRAPPHTSPLSSTCRRGQLPTGLASHSVQLIPRC